MPTYKSKHCVENLARWVSKKRKFWAHGICFPLQNLCLFDYHIIFLRGRSGNVLTCYTQNINAVASPVGFVPEFNYCGVNVQRKLFFRQRLLLFSYLCPSLNNPSCRLISFVVHLVVAPIMIYPLSSLASFFTTTTTYYYVRLYV